MTLLITAADVVTLAFNDKNFLSAKIIDANIEVAQEALLRPALGDAFYESLTSGVPAGDNATMVNSYLKKALAMYVKYVMLPEIMVHTSNTGMQVVQPIGTVSATDKQSGTLRDQAKESANILLKSALRYIEANPTKYPLYEYGDTIRATTRVMGGVIFSKSN
jgi:hypothetical protein